jgi:MFS family permease
MVPTLLQDLSPPQVRGRLMSVITLLFIVATGMAPILVGLISDQMPHGSRGLLWAIVGIAVPAFLVAGVSLCLVEKAFRRTLDEVAGVAPESA